LGIPRSTAKKQAQKLLRKKKRKNILTDLSPQIKRTMAIQPICHKQNILWKYCLSPATEVWSPTSRRSASVYTSSEKKIGKLGNRSIAPAATKARGQFALEERKKGTWRGKVSVHTETRDPISPRVFRHDKVLTGAGELKAT